MAEGWARQLSRGDHDFVSAGTVPASQVNPLAVEVMRERGVSLEGQRPKSMAEVGPVDLFVGVCAQAATTCPAPLGANVLRWDLPDPADATGTREEVLEVFRESRDAIERLVRQLLSDLEPDAQESNAVERGEGAV